MPESPSAQHLTPADLIERSQWDFFWVPDDATVVDRPELLYVRCPRDLPLLNCASRTVVDDRIDALVDEVASAHAGVTSRWLVRDRSDRAVLEAALARRGYVPGYEHGAFALAVSGHQTATRESAAGVRAVGDMATLRDWYVVADAVFEMAAGHPEHELERFLRECTGPGARVHRFVSYQGDDPVSCGGMTSFPSLGFGYLWAGATLESARGHGFYRAVLDARLSRARQLGLTHVGVYARVGTSAPIVRKVGFEQAGDMCYWDRPAG